VFSARHRKKPLSHYKISQSHIIAKSTFKDENHIDTVKPGTLLGITDSKGNDYFESKLNKKQEENKEEGLNL